jgi:hypothetical protein
MRIDNIECTYSVDPEQWDTLAMELGGSFHHCHAYAMHESSRPNVTPVFVKAFNQAGECEGIAVGSILCPRFWPTSSYCKGAFFGALPATRNNSAETEQEIMSALTDALYRKGVFEIRFAAYESRNSASVLPSLSYQTKDRFEFYIDLTKPLDELWSSLKPTRRNKIRKATKMGVESRIDNNVGGLALLHRFQGESLQRRGIEFSAESERAEMMNASLLDTERAVLLVSYKDDEPINAALFGYLGGKVY